MKNDCYKCPYRKNVPGSAHSECGHPYFDGKTLIAAFLILRNIKHFEPYITINEYGYLSGWAAWPINFDTTWITCSLPMPENEQQ